MRYALLSYVCCPACRGALACFIAHERPTKISSFVAERAPRAPAADAAFTPAPPFASSTPLTARLTALAGAAAPARNREAVVESGLLICGGCARWFPIVDTLPELLPDHLRDSTRDAVLLETLATQLPGDVRGMLRTPGPEPQAGRDAGAHYKRAEITVAAKVEDPVSFFGPGYSAPFNPGNTEFTLYLISLFGNVVRMLGVDGRTSHSAVVIDSGCGYGWTTEWLGKSGLEAIGVDITRDYLEIAVERIGESSPHFIVADVENLPIRDGCAHAVLAFESFHHLPDRPAAMAGYARALSDGGVALLAEPGAAHGDADVSKDTMERFGILEKGMELEDVEDYVAGAPFAPPERHFVLHASLADLKKGVTQVNAWRHSLFYGHIFRVRKDASVVAPKRQASAPDLPPEMRVPIDTIRELDAELQRRTAELHAVRNELRDSRIAALDATQKIEAMRRSAFWRAREIWVRIRGSRSSRSTGPRTNNG